MPLGFDHDLTAWIDETPVVILISLKTGEPFVKISGVKKLRLNDDFSGFIDVTCLMVSDYSRQPVGRLPCPVPLRYPPVSNISCRLRNYFSSLVDQKGFMVFCHASKPVMESWLKVGYAKGAVVILRFDHDFPTGVNEAPTAPLSDRSNAIDKIACGFPFRRNYHLSSFINKRPGFCFESVQPHKHRARRGTINDLLGINTHRMKRNPEA